MKRLLIITAGLCAFVVAGAAFFLLSVSVHSGVAVPPRGAVLENVTVVNPGRERRAGMTVACEGGRIADISPYRKERPSDTKTRTVKGGYALPGLADMHVHYPPDLPGDQFELFCFLFLAHGVTTTRDMGSLDRSTHIRRNDVTAGKFPGPRIFSPVTFIDGKNPLWPNSFKALTPAEGRAVVAKAIAMGADFIKTYDNVTGEVLAAVVAEAHGRGKRVAGHVPLTVTLEESGIDDVQHLFGVPDPVTVDGRPALTLKTRQAVWRGLTDKRIARVAHFCAERGVAHTATLVVLHRMGKMDSYREMREDPVGALLPRYYSDVVWSPERGLPFLRMMTPKACAELRDTEPLRFRVVKAFRDKGVTLNIGTDVQTPFVVPGASLHEEMKLFTQAGLGLEDVWRLATKEAGKYLGVPGLGEIGIGAPADIALFSEDPTKDPAALKTLTAVVADGRLYTREEIDRGLARYRARFDEPLYDGLTMLMARAAIFFMF